jgi:exopolysaccharide/PEP-CTERM locus tyrosine autokinase
MGKIADALERHKKENATKVEFLHDAKPMKSVSEEQEIEFARDFCTLHECDPKLIVLSAPNSADAENFRILRAQVLFARDGNKPKTLMVTSAFPGEGKTFVCANLAASIALGVDEHVLLVDCDLRNPNLHHFLGFKNTRGLSDHLSKKKPLEELIIQTQQEKLFLLPAGKSPPNPSELLSSTNMNGLLEKVRERYQDRLIVLDAPPSNIAAETSFLARHVDAIIFVIMAGKISRDVITRTMDNLGKDKILGIVFNGYNPSRKAYYKYSPQYYKNT